MLNHPGSATTGPLFGNATTQLLEFDDRGHFVREIGQGIYGFGYSHSARYDKYDNLWIVDKGTNAVTKINPAGYVTLNLGRRPEGYEPPHHALPKDKVHVDGYLDGPTDVGWDRDDNIYVSDGNINSRVAKFDKHGNWIKTWGTYGTEPGQFVLPHNMGVDRDGSHTKIRLRWKSKANHLSQCTVRQNPTTGTWQQESKLSRRNCALDNLYFRWGYAVSVCVRRRTWPNLQNDT